MNRVSVLVGLVGLLSTTPSLAGLYTDDLSRCIVDATSPEDRTNLMKWIFTAMSQHPSVSSLSAVKPADMEVANKTIGQLFMRLLTESCAQKARDAIRIEGVGAVQTSFQVLGQVAASGLFSDPNVAKAMSSLDQYVDKAKLEALAKPAPDTTPALAAPMK